LAETQEAEEEAAGGQRDADGHTDQQQAEEADQQADRQHLVHAHRAALLQRSADCTPCAAACSANSAKPAGISALSSQRCVRPPGSAESALTADDWATNRS